ncbi:MAG: sugar phosphate isomerase/epimerase [Planctomycetota bacterium]|nr:MAG: sugar phosphate isomerase/epimerase [Planctomycetota bacterium]
MTSPLPRRRFLKIGSTGLAGAFLSPPAIRAGSESRQSPAAEERLFRLGLVTYNIARHLDLEALLQACEQLGYEALELRSTHRHGVEPSLRAEERQSVQSRFAASSVKLICLGSACEYHDPRPEVVKKNIEETKAFLGLAHDLEVPAVKVRPNGLPKQVDERTTLRQIAEALRECAETAEGLGVQIWVEVHGRGTAEPERMQRILDWCDHPAVGITWNSNPQDVRNGSIRPAFDMLKPWIRNVHLKELYSGYPYRELFSALRSIGYSGFTLAEIAGSTDPHRVLRYFRALWQELSQPSQS